MKRRLIVTADDFGMSLEVNEAVEEAFRNGILTSASLVTAGAAAQDAIRRAKRMPGLGVGLHLALYGAPSQAAAQDVADLLHPSRGGLGERPVATGARIALSRRLQAQVGAEVAAQFAAYARSGLPLDHLDGHWHCHQHPFVLRTLISLGKPCGLRAVRVTYEPPLASWRAAGRTQLANRVTHAVGHGLLAANMRRRLRANGLAFNDWFFGKTDEGAMDASTLARLMVHLPPGVSELGLHPATAAWVSDHAPPAHWRAAGELAALLDPDVRAACDREGIARVRFGDLSA
ncbi:MAG: hopanoid biosynthesis-associated protein HpnK [Caulobacterales bacterium]|jgi:hopanoid biosynthesis associated protein HpnK